MLGEKKLVIYSQYPACHLENVGFAKMLFLQLLLKVSHNKVPEVLGGNIMCVKLS